MSDDRRFERLSRAWDSVVAWNAGADPLCPCKGLVAPNLNDWLNFRADWLSGAPDASGLDEQTASLREAIATINQYSRSGPIGDLNREFTAYKMGVKSGERASAEGDACAPGDPRCAPLTIDPGPIAASDEAKRAWGLAAVKNLQAQPVDAGVPWLNKFAPDPRMGDGAPASAITNVLAGLPSLLGDTARGAGEEAGKAAGQAAGQAASEAAKTAAPAVANAIGEALKGQLPGLATAAGQAAAPVVAPIATSAGQTAGTAAGNAAVEAARGEARSAWEPVLKLGAIALGMGAVGTGIWALWPKKRGSK